MDTAEGNAVEVAVDLDEVVEIDVRLLPLGEDKGRVKQRFEPRCNARRSVCLITSLFSHVRFWPPTNDSDRSRDRSVERLKPSVWLGGSEEIVGQYNKC